MSIELLIGDIQVVFANKPYWSSANLDATPFVSPSYLGRLVHRTLVD
jgi:hypothetical protein